MKSIQQIVKYGSSLILLLFVFTSCGTQPTQKIEEAPLPPQNSVSSPTAKANPVDLTTLPVEYQKPRYTIGNEQAKESKELAHSDVIMKVGASIHSTTGPQPLRDIIKRLASLKGMNISWASDVDQNALVDVDINANDDFDEAIDHLLRQISYYHEIKGNTLLIGNKQTRQWHLAMPFIKQRYSTDTGGDTLGGAENSTAFKGKITLNTSTTSAGTSTGEKDDKNSEQFDIWKNVETNLKVILDILETSTTTVTNQEREFGVSSQNSGNGNTNSQNKTAAAKPGKTIKTSRQTSKTGAYFTIDKPVGIITVTATQDLLEKVDNYITSLKKELYKQVNIEAKIIEVQLTKNSDIGLNWTKCA